MSARSARNRTSRSTRIEPAAAEASRARGARTPLVLLLSKRATLAILILILAAAAVLRLARCTSSLPGLQVDEASNAWNAYCLLKTGADQHGVKWPVFYNRAFGDNRSSLYLYFLLPVQAIGGLGTCTTRLPAALGGVATVALLYVIGVRLFGRAVGLTAAALLALNPWHLQHTRWGHEATLCPLLVLVAWGALLWANAPLDDAPRLRLHPWRALVAGAVVGACCYGYAAVRLFLPVFLSGAFAVTWPSWREQLKKRGGLLAAALLLVGLAATFGPLAWKHLTDPAINKRGETTWVWDPTDKIVEKAGKAAARYAPHFGFDFLFGSGDTDPALSPPAGFGLFPRYTLPLMLLGLGTLLARLRTSAAARVLLAAVLLYPVGDLLNEHPSMHALRSLPGICGLVLLGAVGAGTAGAWLRDQRRAIVLGVAGAFGLWVVLSSGAFLRSFFGDFNRSQDKFYVRHVDLLEAAAWLRPRLAEVDQVFCTTRGMAHPYVHAAVGLQYDPKQWFADAREVIEGPLPWYRGADYYLRFGKVWFMFAGDSALMARSQAAIDALRSNGRRDRVVFIVRPGEFSLEKTVAPALKVQNPEGSTVLLVFDILM